MKKILLFVFIITGNFFYGQVGVGTDMPNPSSQLEISANNRGLLIPRIALSSDTDQTTISAGNVESLLVYNTSTNATLSPGYYYWYQGSWKRLTTESDLPDNMVFWDVTNNQFIYVDENDTTQIIDISDLETLTVLNDNGNGTFTYTDEDGNDVTFDANTTSVSEVDGVYTFTDGNGSVITTIDTNASSIGFDNSSNDFTSDNVQAALEELLTAISTGAGVSLLENSDGTFSLVADNGTVLSTISKSDLTDAGDGSYTFTNGDGTDVTFDVNTVDVSLNATTNEYEFKDSEGNVIGSIAMNADNVSYDNATSGLTATDVQSAIDELVSDLANTTDALVDNGDGTFTHTAVDGTAVTFDVNTTAINGVNIDATTGDVKLGGDLIEPTTITTDATNTLSVAGLVEQTGSALDDVDGIMTVEVDGTIRKVYPVYSTTTAQNTLKTWVDGSPVYERVGEVSLATSTNIVSLAGVIPSGAKLLGVRLINQVTNSISTNIVRYNSATGELVLGTAGVLTTLQPAGNYYVIIEYVE